MPNSTIVRVASDKALEEASIHKLYQDDADTDGILARIEDWQSGHRHRVIFAVLAYPDPAVSKDPVGICIIVHHVSDLYMIHTYVKPENRLKGLGRRMVSTAKEVLPTRAVYGWHTEDSCAFYIKTAVANCRDRKLN